MRAFEVQNSFGLDSLKLVDRQDPRPGPGQVLLRLRALSLNYRDLLVVKGLYNPRLRLPFVPFSDGVGEIVELGPGVTRVKTGERVAGIFMQTWLAGKLTEPMARSALGGGGPGMLAEYVVLDQEGIVPVPSHLTDEEAACLPCAAVTAWHALLTDDPLGPAHSVLILGTGGVSIFALQFASLAGARCLITSSSDRKLERAAALGASAGVNYKTSPEWDKWARKETEERGVDHVVEVGGSGTLSKSLKAVRIGGRISLIGVLAGGGDVSLLPVLMRNICVQGIYVGSREMFENMNDAVSRHQLRPVVDKVFPFTEAREALRYMEKGSHFGKIALKV
jgi:NADPH:quinone reductase-like Zn-dependent oxidoreductase